MAEWSIAAVLKTVEGHTSGGSNPSLSAEKAVSHRLAAFFSYGVMRTPEVRFAPTNLAHISPPRRDIIAPFRADSCVTFATDINDAAITAPHRPHCLTKTITITP